MTTPQTSSALAARPVLRIGDAERLQTSVVLQDAAAAGRLTLDELDERLGAASAARTGPELAVLVADLPVPAPSPDRGARLRRTSAPHPVLPVLAVLLVVTVLSAAASLRAGFPVVWPLGVVLLLLWRRSGRPSRRTRDLDWSR